LSPEDQNDVDRFKSLVEKGGVDARGWVATVVLQSDCQYSNSDRLDVLSRVIDLVVKGTEGDGVILFPGGWFSAGNQKVQTLYKWVEEQVGRVLSEKARNLIACLGIDGRKTSEWARDQIGAAISKNGIIALGRKFHPAPSEKEYVDLAKDHLAKEEGKTRIFELGGRKYFICACYDSFGIKQKGIPNFGIDVVLDLVHGFYPKGEGGSGDVYFAKHGFAGASKEWDCLVFGAAVFFNRKIPEYWPSGVYWNQGSKKSTQKWRYADNPFKPQVRFEQSIKEGVASVRIYNLEVI
jgi:hypothetical protein